jgi:pSer/pThr/pTyr-binding forkhead associated (FHA) protein
MWTLQGVDPEHAALLFRILPGTLKTVGRAPRADFVIDVPLVSRVHCRLAVSETGELELEDMGSTNGTFVNGKKVTAKTMLNDGDRVMFGRVEFLVNSGADRASEQKTAWRAD